MLRGAKTAPFYQEPQASTVAVMETKEDPTREASQKAMPIISTTLRNGALIETLCRPRGSVLSDRILRRARYESNPIRRGRDCMGSSHDNLRRYDCGRQPAGDRCADCCIRRRIFPLLTSMCTSADRSRHARIRSKQLKNLVSFRAVRSFCRSGELHIGGA